MSEVPAVGISFFMLFVIILVIGAVILVMVILAARKNSAAAPRVPSMTRDQRLATLRSKEDRYVEERGRILSMVEEGKLSPEDADRLFDSLERETTHMSCPYCSEDVRIEAIKCRHCKQMLIEQPPGQKRLTKSADRAISGVCGGIAEHLGMDVTLMRIITALVVLFTGIFTGVIVYVIAACIMPEA